MRSAVPDGTADPAGDRLPALPGIVIAIYFAALVPFRLSMMPELRPEHREIVAAMAVAILAVQLLLVVGGIRRRRPGPAIGLLALVTLLTYLPIPLTGEWLMPLAGCLAGALLLLLRPPVALSLFAVVVAMEAVIRSWQGQSLDLVAFGVTATANIGVSVFALAWLSALARELHGTKRQHAEAAAVRERLEAAWRLRGVLADSLARMEEKGERALESLAGAPAKAMTETEELIRIARRALAGVRVVAASFSGPLPASTGWHRAPAPRLVWLVVVVFAVTAAVQQVANLGEAHGMSWSVLAPATLVAAGLVALMVRHASTVLRGIRPKGWPVTLALQAVLNVVPYALFGPPWNASSALLAGAAVLLVRSPWRWACVAAVLAMHGLNWLWWDVGTAVSLGHLGVVVVVTAVIYAVGRLAELAGHLDDARDRLAELAVRHERLRLSRDIHDLLGLGLSTITLKAELAVRLIGRDPARARTELIELVEVTAKSLAQVHAVTAEEEQVLTLDEEAAKARAALTAAGADVQVDLTCVPLPPALDTTLAVVLRESVTNILRHATPRCCTIKTTVHDGVLRLRVDNDGVREMARGCGGAGLANLAARAEALGGVVTAGPDGDGRFVLRAELPAEVRGARRGVPQRHGGPWRGRSASADQGLLSVEPHLGEAGDQQEGEQEHSDVPPQRRTQ